MLAPLLAALEFRCNNSAYRPVMDAIDLLARYAGADSDQKLYAAGEKVPVDGVVPKAWLDGVTDGDGRVERLPYELCVLIALRDALRRREVYVQGAGRWKDPDEDLPGDFEDNRDVHYAELAKPLDAAEFTGGLQKRLGEGLTRLDTALARGTSGGVRIITRQGSPWVSVPKLGKLPEPRNLGALKAEVERRWGTIDLLDILKDTAFITGFTDSFTSVASREVLDRATLNRRLLLVLFALGTNMGIRQMAVTGEHGVGEAELRHVRATYVTRENLRRAITTVVNATLEARDPKWWGEATSTASDSKRFASWDSNLMTHIRYGGFGGIAYRLISDTYIALFSHFIPCGVWEAVYILDSLLADESDVQPDQIHADTQGQSLPVFGLAALPGFELLPRIRNWHDLNFYRPDATTKYGHIDALFGDNVIDWALIEKHWPDLLRAGISIREGRLSSVTLLRRLGNHSRRNRLYKALRELGRVIRTITLLRYLPEPGLRDQIGAITNRTEQFHNFAQFLMIGGRLIGHNDPDYQERVVKFNELVANAAIFSTALDITDAANALAGEGFPVDTDDLATVSPYITRTIRRFGSWVVDLTPPDRAPATRLDLEPRVLFRVLAKQSYKSGRRSPARRRPGWPGSAGPSAGSHA